MDEGVRDGGRASGLGAPEVDGAPARSRPSRRQARRRRATRTFVVTLGDVVGLIDHARSPGRDVQEQEAKACVREGEILRVRRPVEKAIEKVG